MVTGLKFSSESYCNKIGLSVAAILLISGVLVLGIIKDSLAGYRDIIVANVFLPLGDEVAGQLKEYSDNRRYITQISVIENTFNNNCVYSIHIEITLRASHILYASVVKDISRIIGATEADKGINEIIFDNVDHRARSVIMLIDLFFHVVLLMAAWTGARLLCSHYKAVHYRIVEDSRKYYWPDVLRMNRLGIIIFAASTLAMAGIFITACIMINLYIAVPPEIVPSKLIYIDELISNIKTYYAGLRASALAVRNIEKTVSFADVTSIAGGRDIADISSYIANARRAVLFVGMPVLICMYYVLEYLRCKWNKLKR